MTIHVFDRESSNIRLMKRPLVSFIGSRPTCKPNTEGLLVLEDHLFDEVYSTETFFPFQAGYIIRTEVSSWTHATERLKDNQVGLLAYKQQLSLKLTEILVTKSLDIQVCFSDDFITSVLIEGTVRRLYNRAVTKVSQLFTTHPAKILNERETDVWVYLNGTLVEDA